MPIYLGIDPGIEGAACVLSRDGPRVVSMPVKEVAKGHWEVDAGILHDFLASLPEPPKLACIEQVNADPAFGSKASFSFGRNFGMALAVLQILGIPYTRARPQQWKASILKGTDKSKQAAIDYVRSRWPKADLTPPGAKRPSHDWAESACLALYAKESDW